MKSKKQARKRSKLPKREPLDPNYLLEHERGAKPGIKYHPKRMATQAAPDHGEHE